jgi:uncharacterized protein
LIGLYKIFDAHVHFYSNTYFKYLVKQKTNRVDINTELRNLASKGHIEIPGEDPAQLAKRWIEIIDKWKLERLVLISSIPGDEESIVKAVNAFPSRFSGIFTIDPNSNLLMETATKRMQEDKLKGVMLYPSLYQIHVNDEWLYPLYNLIQECNGIMLVHFGKLIMRSREYAGIPLITNDEYAKPQDLIPVAKKFSGIKFIIPNFGAGMFEETLEVGNQCSNVFVDTAGSNSWITEHPTKPDMRRVFQKFLEVFTAKRILFGSDSGMLPRGYRYDIVDNQLKLVQEMRIPIPDIKKIFYENMAGLIDNV